MRRLVHLLAVLTSASVLATEGTFTSSLDDIGEFFDIPESMRGDGALAVALPGSAETYDSVYYVSDRTWNAYTNGVHVLTNATISLVYNSDATVGGVYRLAYDLQDPLSSIGVTVTSLNRYTKWHPGIFDFNATGATSGGGPVIVNFSSSGGSTRQDINNITGADCYQPKAARISAGTVAGVLSSYDAYFERLYYASEGNERDYGEEWGPNEPGSDFPFNLTNDEYSASCYFDFDGVDVSTGGVRRIPDTRKIADRLDLANFQTNVLVNMLSTEGVSNGNEKPVNPGFIYRPKGILDASDPTNGTTWVWWASQDNPPKWYWEFSQSCVQDPASHGFGFFPTFGWMENPICDEFFYQRFDWPTKCVTLHMATTAYPTHPARKLFELVCGTDSCELDLDGYVKPYRFGANLVEADYPLVEWMTNAYMKAGMAFTDRAASFDSYRLTSGAAVYGGGPLRRILPNDYVGVNHVLASINRTIMIPNMTLVTTNECTYVSRQADYGLTLPLTYDIHADGTVEVHGTKRGTGTLEKTSETNDVTVSTYGYEDVFGLSTTAASGYANSSRISGTCHGTVWLGESFLSDFGHIGQNEISIDALIGAPSNFIRVDFILNNINATANVYCQVNGATGDVHMVAQANRAYQYDIPKIIRPKLGPTQPGVSGSGRVKEGRAVVLSRLNVGSDVQYRSEEKETFGSRQGLVSSIGNCLASMKASLKGRIMAKNGAFDYENPNVYAPLPTSLQCEWDMSDEQVVSFVSLPDTAHPEKIVQGDTWLIFANVTNVVTFQHWKNFYISETETKTYDVNVTVYEGSGLVVSNEFETGSSVTPSGYGEEDAGTIPVGNEEISGEYRAGPFAVVPDTVQVPDYQQHNTVPITRNFKVTSKFGEYTITKTCRSGTGENNPGEVNSNETYTVSIHLGIEQTELDIVVGDIEIGEPYVDMTGDVHSEDAIRREGGNVELRGTYHVTYEKAANGTVSLINPFIRWNVKQTGAFFEDEAVGLPWKIGTLTCNLTMDAELRSYVIPGGCTTGVEGTGNSKAITQVDWRFKNLKKE